MCVFFLLLFLALRCNSLNVFILSAALVQYLVLLLLFIFELTTFSI